MSKVQPDYSFEREGIPLSEWLMRLVSDDRPAREAAGLTLQSMQWALPSVHTDLNDVLPDLDGQAHADRFKLAIREAINASDFDTAEFVTRLCAYSVATYNDWTGRVAQVSDRKKPVDEQWERIAQKLVDRINCGTPQEKELANKRMTRALCAATARDQGSHDSLFEGAEAMSSAWVMAHYVLRLLDSELLAAPEAIQLLLDHEQHSRDALQALVRIGPPAIDFAPQLLERISKPISSGRIDRGEAQALGSIGRGNQAIVDQLVGLLAAPETCDVAAYAFTEMGTDVAGRERVIVRRLLELVERDPVCYSAILALASVGGNDPAARGRVLDFARPRPAIIVPYEGSPEYKYDRTMVERSVAIEATQYLTDYPGECIPILIEALDSFDEYDSDLSYSGPAARIAFALERFGSNAAPAAVPLARKLSIEEGDRPTAILGALAAMGTAARPALEFLEAYQRQVMKDRLPCEPDDDPPTRESDPLRWAIQTVRGVPSR